MTATVNKNPFPTRFNFPAFLADFLCRLNGFNSGFIQPCVDPGLFLIVPMMKHNVKRHWKTVIGE